MKKVTAYKTSDGRIFENELEAIDYENTIKFKDEIMELLVKKDVLHSNETMEFIVENRDLLKDIFSKL
jgi:hypothetical protein